MEKPELNIDVPGSFRDPSGFLFYQDGSLYRQVNIDYREDYDHLMKSGLYKALTDAGLLIPHDEADIAYARTDKAYKIIKPEPVQFISYPYEWCFSQFRDAALLTLKIQKKSLDFGMSLKDCSAYNIQFSKCIPVFIDTLSFERYRPQQCWIAYRQFCQHFIAPLSLMCCRDIRLNQLLRIYIDGIPLDLASSLLPLHTRLRFSLLCHIHLHAKSQKHYADKPAAKSTRKMSRLSLMGLIDSLEATIQKLKWQPKGTQWADYYEDTNYSENAVQHKKQIIADYLDQITPKTVWDLGANMGMFSRIAGDRGIKTISFDIDPAAVEKNYIQCCSQNEANILPLLLDLTNPSSGIGWENQERMSFLQRGPADTVFALALIHHLAISNNLPFIKLAGFFSKICNSLIIEFIPKSDSQVRRLLSSREDIFTDYCQNVFESEFNKFFTIQDSVKIRESERTLYLMKRRYNKSLSE